jgi:hypothetical protein
MSTKPSSFRQAVRLVRRICQVAGAHRLIDDSRVGLARHGVIAAVRRHDTPVIFDWLFDLVSYQGVSDSVAYGYMERHGRVRGTTSPTYWRTSRVAPSSLATGRLRIAATERARVRAPILSIGPIAPCRDMICATGG